MRDIAEHEFERVRKFALDFAGLNLPLEKKALVLSRLHRRLRATGLENFADYLQILERHDADAQVEQSHFVSALTTNVTGMFREPHHFSLLLGELASLKARRDVEMDPIRIWSAGCSSGEEALSIAAISVSYFGAEWTNSVRILATDIDSEVLAKAANRTVNPSTPEELGREIKNELRINVDFSSLCIKKLQSGITYARHNLIHGISLSRPFDIIFCRNVTIYFDLEVQTKVHATLIASLANDGLLIIGHSERLLDHTFDTELVGPTSYRKLDPSSKGPEKWH